MSLSLQKLRSFITVAEEKQFLRAAQKLGVTQPTLSAQIRELEEELAVQLFVRTTRQVHLTIEGDRFFRRTQKILSDIDVAVEEAKGLSALKHGRVSIATTPSAGRTMLPIAIALFRKSFPEIAVHVREDLSPVVDNLVSMGVADFGIGPQFDRTSPLSFVSLFEERFFAVVACGHPLTRQKDVSLKELVAHGLIPTREGSGVRELVEAALRKEGLLPDTSFELSNLETLVAMVREGLGVGLLPELILPHTLTDRLAIVPLRKPGISRSIGFIEKKGGSASAASAAFLSLLRSVCAEHALHYEKAD